MGLTFEVTRYAGPVCQVSVVRPQVVVHRIGMPGAKGDKGDDGSFAGTTSDDLPEGETNRYYTSEVETAIAEALDGKAASSHTHDQSEVTGLVDSLAAKANAPIVALCSADYAWSTTLIDQPWSIITIPSAGVWHIEIVLLNASTANQSLTPRLVMGTAAISGSTGDCVGTGSTVVTGATITTGSPTIIGMAAGGPGAGLPTGKVYHLVVTVVTPGTIKLQIAHNNGGGGLKTCKGSFIKLTKLA